MKEKNLQILFGHWLKNNFKSSAAFELKICKTDRFNLKCIAQHQISNLNLVHHGLFFYKLPDLGLQNPFDCFTLYREEAYVVIFFYKPRRPKVFYMIPVGVIQGLINDCIKSIDEETANKLAYRVGILK